MPHMKELYAKYHDRGLDIVNISVENANARGALEKLVAKLELPWPQLFDGKADQIWFLAGHRLCERPSPQKQFLCSNL